MKIGIISKGSPDYLIDIVTDGLIRILGRENLSLDYNARGGWGGQYAILLQGFAGPEPFDIHEADALVGSVRSLDAIEEWMKKTGRKKVAVIDGEDGPDIRSPWDERGVVYFKREFLKGGAYSPRVRPLPFGAIPEALPPVTEVSRAVFFRAHGSSPIRARIEETLRELGFPSPPGRVEKDEYNRDLASSLVGVSVRGGGWDTYRYWEIPYLGVALISQRLEIVIPDDFEDGVEAVFFSDLDDFRKKLLGMLDDPEKTRSIGLGGRKKCLERHLSIHRARTVLEAIS